MCRLRGVDSVLYGARQKGQLSVIGKIYLIRSCINTGEVASFRGDDSCHCARMAATELSLVVNEASRVKATGLVVALVTDLTHSVYGIASRRRDVRTSAEHYAMVPRPLVGMEEIGQLGMTSTVITDQ